MCLNSITNWCKKNEGYGYKVFRVYHNKLYSEMRDKLKVRPINKWITCVFNPIEIADYYYEGYLSGFHIYKFKKDAKCWKSFSIPAEGQGLAIKRVKYRKLITSGSQYGKVIVAKEIKILKEDNK